MSESNYREPVREEERQRVFERTNRYGSDLAPAIEEERNDVRFETATYIILNDLRVIFK